MLALKRIAIVALVVAAAAAMLWPTLRESPAKAPSTQEASARELVARDDEPQAAPAANSASERRALDVPAQAAATTSAPQLRIVAVTADQTPAAHARILVAKPGIDPQAWEDAQARFGSYAEALAHGFGDEHEADEHGELALPIFEHATRACAWSNRLFGWKNVEAGVSQCAIELHAVRSLDVEVVDTLGTPVPNVCIALIAIAEVDLTDVWSAWTDEVGRVRVLDLAELRWEGNTRWRIGPAYGSARPEFVELDEHSSTWPHEVEAPIRFVLGPTGSVEFTLADEGGQPLAVQAELGMCIDKTRLAAERALEDRDWHSRYTSDGRARFEHVELDLPLAVRVRANGFEFDAPNDLRAPSSPGETARHMLRCRRVFPIARGRIVAADGRSLDGAWLAALRPAKDGVGLNDGSAPLFATWIRRDGTFDQGLQDAARDLELPELVLVACDTNRAACFARVHPPPLAPAERSGLPPSYDFGTVVVDALPALATGIVVDDDGRPIACAQIDAFDFDSGNALDLSYGAICETDVDGHFVVCGALRPAQMLLHAQTRDDGQSNLVTVDPGATDVRLVVHGRGRIVGSVLLPEGLTIDDVDLEFSGVAAGAGVQKLLHCSSLELLEHDGFTSGYVDAGTWSLAISSSGADEPIERRDGLDLRPGQTLDVGSIDLRAAFRPTTLKVVDQQGLPVVDANLRFFDAQASSVGSLYLETGQPTLTWVPRNAASACVWAEGFRTETFATSDHATWTLRKAYSVRLRWPKSLPPIEPPLQLVVYGSSATDALCSRLMRFDLDRGVASDAEILAEASASGPWELGYSISNERKRGIFVPRMQPAQQIEIADTEQSQVFTIEIDPAALASAIARARGE